MPSVSSATRDTFRQGANVLFATTQVLASYFHALTGLGEPMLGSADDFVRTPVTPAGYAFAIWGLIYVSSALYAIYQAAPARRKNARLRRVGWWTAAGFLATTTWALLSQAGASIALLAVVLALIVAPFAVAYLRLARDPSLISSERLFTTFPIALYAGWVSVAVFANAASALAEAGFMSDAIGALLVLAALAVTSALTGFGRGNLTYALAVAWGFVAVLVADLREGYPMSAAASALAATSVLLTAARLNVRLRSTLKRRAVRFREAS